MTDSSPVTPCWPESTPTFYPCGVPQFIYPNKLHAEIPAALLFPSPPVNNNTTFPSPVEPVTVTRRLPTIHTTYRLTHTIDEYAAAAGLLSVFERQN